MNSASSPGGRWKRPCAQSLPPPRLLRLLDPLLRGGDEVPPDVARPLQRCPAEQHHPRALRPGLQGRPGRPAGTPSSAPHRRSLRRCSPRLPRRRRPGPRARRAAGSRRLAPAPRRHRTSPTPSSPAPSRPRRCRGSAEPASPRRRITGRSPAPACWKSGALSSAPSAAPPRSGCRRTASPPSGSHRPCARNG